MAEGDLSIRVLSTTGFCHVIFPLTHGLRATLNVYMSFQPDINSIMRVIGQADS